MSRRKKDPAMTFAAAKGSPFSDTDVQELAPILLRIAEENGVDNIRMLDKRIVFSYAEREEEWLAPLRAYVFKNDDETEARNARIDRCALLIRSVRVVTIDGIKLHRPQPAFYPTDHTRGLATSTQSPRGHVLRGDALLNDPVFASVVSKQIRDITNALVRLEDFTSFRKIDPELARLRDQLREAIDEYTQAIAQEAAAEE